MEPLAPPETLALAVTQPGNPTAIIMLAVLQDHRGLKVKATKAGLSDLVLKAHGPGCQWRKLSDDDLAAIKALPRAFRDAWRDTGKAVEIDLDAAREGARNRVREARRPKFAAADAALTMARETGRLTAPLLERKQRLRDAPADPRIAAAASPAELEAAMNAVIAEL